MKKHVIKINLELGISKPKKACSFDNVLIESPSSNNSTEDDCISNSGLFNVSCTSGSDSDMDVCVQSRDWTTECDFHEENNSLKKINQD